MGRFDFIALSHTGAMAVRRSEATFSREQDAFLIWNYDGVKIAWRGLGWPRATNHKNVVDVGFLDAFGPLQATGV